MKKTAAFIIGLTMLATAFSGCDKNDSSQAESEGEFNILPVADTATPDVTPPPKDDSQTQTPLAEKELISGYNVSLVKTHDYTDALNFPHIAVIKTQEELEAYLSKKAEFIGYYNEITPEDLTGKTGNLFGDDLNLSTADFFDENFLVIVIMEENSGSISLSFEGVEWADDTLNIDITRNVPEIGTDDMAQWQLFLTLPAEYIDKVTAENIKLC